MNDATETSDEPHPAGGSDHRSFRQAVVVIHGMGNQSPMSTLRGFVEAIWTRDTALKKRTPVVWSKRDRFSDDFELRRITTGSDDHGTKTDFLEFYWAHLMEGTTLASVLWWFDRLFKRPIRRVPSTVFAPWIFGTVALILAAALAIAVPIFLFLSLTMQPEHARQAFCWLVAAVGLATILWALRHRVLVAVVGDAARYLTPDPQNIGARAEIRKLGVKLLEKLHEQENGRDKYDRIIIVSHSLGTVIGYDILNYYWSGISSEFDLGFWDKRHLTEIEAVAKSLTDDPKSHDRQAAFRKAQREFAKVLAEKSKGRWRITDFVTLGSPLTHAHFLMVNDNSRTFPSDEAAVRASWIGGWYRGLDKASATVAQLFAARAAQREFPLCPPVTESGDRFLYGRKTVGATIAVPHHAALFASVRWTNIYAPRKRILWGDVVGGPVAPLFGPGVRDVALTGVVAGSFVAHTKYWLLPEEGPVGESEHLKALREAVNLQDN